MYVGVFRSEGAVLKKLSFVLVMTVVAYIPRGFAHGFLVLSDYAVFSYKCDDYYTPGDEGSILWSDPC